MFDLEIPKDFLSPAQARNHYRFFVIGYKKIDVGEADIDHFRQIGVATASTSKVVITPCSFANLSIRLAGSPSSCSMRGVPPNADNKHSRLLINQYLRSLNPDLRQPDARPAALRWDGSATHCRTFRFPASGQSRMFADSTPPVAARCRSPAASPRYCRASP